MLLGTHKYTCALRSGGWGDPPRVAVFILYRWSRHCYITCPTTSCSRDTGFDLPLPQVVTPCNKFITSRLSGMQWHLYACFIARYRSRNVKQRNTVVDRDTERLAGDQTGMKTTKRNDIIH